MEAVALPRRRSPGTVVLVVLGTIVTAGLIGIVAFMLLDTAAQHSFSTTARYTSVRTLVVSSGAGSVTLTSAPAGEPLVVRAHETEALFSPNASQRLARDGTLSLTASCPGKLRCSVDYTVSVPRDVAVKVSSGFGDIRATGLSSVSSIQLGTTAGAIHAAGLSAPGIRLTTGVGDLTATLAQPARRLHASTFAGGLRLTVPDTSYALHVSSGVGHVSYQGVRSDPASPRTIDATSSVGDITITPR
jgi:hypothetical protein